VRGGQDPLTGCFQDGGRVVASDPPRHVGEREVVHVDAVDRPEQVGHGLGLHLGVASAPAGLSVDEAGWVVHEHVGSSWANVQAICASSTSSRTVTVRVRKLVTPSGPFGPCNGEVLRSKPAVFTWAARASHSPWGACPRVSCGRGGSASGWPSVWLTSNTWTGRKASTRRTGLSLLGSVLPWSDRTLPGSVASGSLGAGLRTTGAKMVRPVSPLRTCRPTCAHVLYPATFVACGICDWISIVLPQFCSCGTGRRCAARPPTAGRW
jgi:hypothetical protein